MYVRSISTLVALASPLTATLGTSHKHAAAYRHTAHSPQRTRARHDSVMTDPPTNPPQQPTHPQRTSAGSALPLAAACARQPWIQCNRTSRRGRVRSKVSQFVSLGSADAPPAAPPLFSIQNTSFARACGRDARSTSACRPRQSSSIFSDAANGSKT